MTGKLRIDFPHEKIVEFCRRRHITGLWAFGSALRADFRPDSDVDLLVQFESGVRPRLSDLIAMEDELAALLNRKVDLVERGAVERSPNYIRRKSILSSLEPVHVTG